MSKRYAARYKVKMTQDQKFHLWRWCHENFCQGLVPGQPERRVFSMTKHREHWLLPHCSFYISFKNEQDGVLFFLRYAGEISIQKVEA